MFQYEDYAFDPTRHCSVSWAFPSVVEDNELAEIDDAIYQDEIRRVRSEMQEVVKQAEEQMAEQLYEMLTHIAERLQSDESGQRKTFRSDTIAKVFDEIDLVSQRMRESGIGGEGLQQTADRLRNLFGGQDRETLPAALRTSDAYRQDVQRKCEEIAGTLLQTSVTPVRRKLLLSRVAKRRQ